MSNIEVFKAFLHDEKAWDMFITGPAGTGKTTSLAELLSFCLDNDIDAHVCAFTHKACNILRSKLPENILVSTLHSFLNKRPTINEHATKKEHISTNKKMGKTAKTQILFVDEFSQVGEKDLMDLRAEQDEDYDGIPGIKIVWIGDLNQLPPVGDQQTLKAKGQYWVKLTKIYRQAGDSPLLDPLSKLVSYISREAEPEPLEANKAFIRNVDIVSAYKSSKSADKVMLAYTNQRVQALNAEINDGAVATKVFCPTRQRMLDVFEMHISKPAEILTPFNGVLTLGSKFKTLEYLHKAFSKTVSYGAFTPEGEEDIAILAYVFGHYNYKVILDELKKTAAAANSNIEQQYRGFKAAAWAKANPTHPLARARAKAWRDFFTFSECVVCIDYPYAMTVHKSQGSTYSDVYIDTDDLGAAAEFDFEQYLKLMYVAISRASNKVYTN